MAAVTVIARPGKIVTDSITITMHAVVLETHQLSNTVTDHPVEEGFNASDHSRPDPDRVTMDCRISNTPLSSGQATEAVRSGAFTFQTTTAAADAAGNIGAVDGYAQKCWTDLRKLRDDGTIVKVVTTMGDYDSMAIESISLPRSAKYYDAISFTINFKRVRIVQNKLTRGVKGPPQVQPKKHAGNKTPKTSEEKETSALVKISEKASESSNKTVSGVGNFLLGGSL